MANLTPTGSSGKSAVPSLNHTGLSRGLKDREHTRSFSTRLFRKHTRSLSTRSSGNTPDHLVLDCQEIYLIAQCSSFKGKIALLGSLLLLLHLGITRIFPVRFNTRMFRVWTFILSFIYIYWLLGSEDQPATPGSLNDLFAPDFTTSSSGISRNLWSLDRSGLFRSWRPSIYSFSLVK